MQREIRFIVAVFFLFAAGLAFSGCGTVYSAARDERSIGNVVDDKNREAKIKYNLLDDDQVKGLDISVYVFYGDAYLVGVVETGAQRSRAVAIARQVEGIRSVTTYLLDKSAATVGKSVDDVAIKAKVKAKMIGDKEMKSTQVEVKSVFGHVVLLGIVGSQKDADKAVKYARGVEYVKSVKSFIRVR